MMNVPVLQFLTRMGYVAVIAVTGLLALQNMPQITDCAGPAGSAPIRGLIYCLRPLLVQFFIYIAVGTGAGLIVVAIGLVQIKRRRQVSVL